MSTTNDPQAPYGLDQKTIDDILAHPEDYKVRMADTATERAPLLSDGAIREMATPYHGPHAITYRFGIGSGRDFYENLISSGDLITKADHERLYAEALDRVFGVKK
jgi:hypothetical protein